MPCSIPFFILLTPQKWHTHRIYFLYIIVYIGENKTANKQCEGNRVNGFSHCNENTLRIKCMHTFIRIKWQCEIEGKDDDDRRRKRSWREKNIQSINAKKCENLLMLNAPAVHFEFTITHSNCVLSENHFSLPMYVQLCVHIDVYLVCVYVCVYIVKYYYFPISNQCGSRQKFMLPLLFHHIAYP